MLTIMLSCLNIVARGEIMASLDDIDLSGLPKQTKAKALRYWFDDDSGSVKTIGLLTGQQMLDVSQLLDGLHMLYFQVIDENNQVADVKSSLFMKVDGKATDITARQLRYWFDDDISTMKTIKATNGKQTLDASQLLDGLHTLHYQVVGSDNAAYHIVSALFMKVDGKATDITARQLRYWFDDDISTMKTITATNGKQTLDASKLLYGLHTVHYQVIGSDNAAYHVASAMFMKMDVKDIPNTLSIRYWFDEN